MIFSKTIRKFKVKAGFTFMEILMVMSLIGLMTGGVLVSYRQTNIRQSLDNGTQKLRQAFTTARANALSGKKDAAVCGAVPLDGWIVNLNTISAPVTFSVYGTCGGNIFPNPATIESIPPGITVAASDTQLLFRPLNRGTDSSVATNISIQNPAGTINFSISASGEILDPTPTPAGCRSSGQSCYLPGQCCSGSCNGGSCL